MYEERNSFLNFLLMFTLLGNVFVDCQADLSYLKGRYTRSTSNKKYSTVVPKKVNRDGDFLSYYLPHFYPLHPDSSRRKRAIGQGSVHYKVPLNGVDHHLELYPNMDFMAPGLVVEEHRQNARGNISDIKLRKVRDYQCQYRGVIRGMPLSSVALSTGHGLAGFIRTGEDEYFIEPVSEEQGYGESEGQLHIVFKRFDVDSDSPTNCGTKGKSIDAWNERMEWEKVNGKNIENLVKGSYQDNQLSSIVNNRKFHKRDKSASGEYESKTSCSPTEPSCTSLPELYLEIMIAVDQKVIKSFKDEDIEIYILTILNMVSTNFFDLSLGRPIHIKMVRLIFMNTEYPELNGARYSPQKLLLNFCNWQTEFNPFKEEHPNHHDFALFITRFEPCQGRIMGVTNMASLCRPDKACAIVHEEGLLLANIITHQLGHSLGAEHDDGESGGCAPEEPDGTKYHMGPIISLSSSEWSICSKQCISNFIATHAGWCLSDIPTDHDFHFPIILPGQVYTAADQCTINFHMKTYPCRVEEFCKALYCQISATACASTGDPPAPGTNCASNMWCFNKQCVHKGQRPGSINGEWGEWTHWSACSRSCGGGVETSHRSCNNPLPSRGGRYCIGNWLRHKMCATQPCLGYSPTFVDIQCKMTDKRPYRGRHYSWNHFHTFFRDSGCTLVCINERGIVAVRSSVVLDGTPCNPSRRDVCIEGECKVVGCDWVIDSKAKEDMCGICHGNGTECRVVQGTFMEPTIKGHFTFLKLPVGTSMIFVRELNPSKCFISISNTINSTTYLNRKTSDQLPGTISIAGAIGAYETKADMERVFIRSAIEVPVAFNIFCDDDINRGIMYQYALPEQVARLPTYRWEYLEWDTCTNACGGGTQMAQPACVEGKSGEVEDKYCQEILKPPIEVRVCNTFPCVANSDMNYDSDSTTKDGEELKPVRSNKLRARDDRPQWWVGPWSECDCSDGQGVMLRAVICMRSKDLGNLRTEVVSDKECCDQPKPRLEKLCNATKEIELIENKYSRDRREKTFKMVPYVPDEEDDYNLPQEDKGNLWYPIINDSANNDATVGNSNDEGIKREIPINPKLDKFRLPETSVNKIREETYGTKLASAKTGLQKPKFYKMLHNNKASSERIGELNNLLKNKAKSDSASDLKIVKNIEPQDKRRLYNTGNKRFYSQVVTKDKHPTLSGEINKKERMDYSNEKSNNLVIGQKYHKQIQSITAVNRLPEVSPTVPIELSLMVGGQKGKAVTTESSNIKGQSTTPWCDQSFIQSVLNKINGSTCEPQSSSEDDEDVPPYNLPSRLETNWTFDQLDIVPIETTKLTLPQTDIEYQVFGRVGYMPVGQALLKQSVSGKDTMLILKEARKHATAHPHIETEEIH